MRTLARHLEVGEPLAAEVADLALGDHMPFAQHDGRGDILAELRMRHGEGDDLGDGRMVHQHVVHLERRDLFAAAVDDLLQPAGDAQIAVLVEHALVAGVEPAMGEGAWRWPRGSSRSRPSRSGRG